MLNDNSVGDTWNTVTFVETYLGKKGACILNTAPPGEKSPLRSGNGCAAITGLTAGRVMDYGLKDSMNMGAAMAPAAKEVIRQHFEDFGRSEKEYDRIITGDLGTVGQKILIDLLLKDGYDISKIHSDCGIEIFDAERQNTGAGGSGCGCSAVTLSAYFLKQIEDGTLKRILFVPTGALLSTVSFNEGMTVPGIAHAVVIEHADA